MIISMPYIGRRRAPLRLDKVVRPRHTWRTPFSGDISSILIGASAHASRPIPLDHHRTQRISHRRTKSFPHRRFAQSVVTGLCSWVGTPRLLSAHGRKVFRRLAVDHRATQTVYQSLGAWSRFPWVGFGRYSSGRPWDHEELKGKGTEQEVSVLITGDITRNSNRSILIDDGSVGRMTSRFTKLAGVRYLSIHVHDIPD